MPNKDFFIKLFVYGTLKEGFSNHNEKYSQGILNIQKAVVQGKLFHLNEGYPAMEIPRENILAIGTKDYLKDSQKAIEAETKIKYYKEPDNHLNTVHGEIITYKNPHIILPLIDELEEFYMNKESTYQRVLIYAKTPEKIHTAWSYIYNLKHNGERVYNGNWIEK